MKHEASLLNKQMDAFIALRIKVESPGFDDSCAKKSCDTGVVTTNPLKSCSPSRTHLQDWRIWMLDAELRRVTIFSQRNLLMNRVEGSIWNRPLRWIEEMIMTKKSLLIVRKYMKLMPQIMVMLTKRRTSSFTTNSTHEIS
uniref:Uncharacterized protein n=1 Tax=Populus trichocarpa TaxID=3694 RepID=A0A3N7HAF4_POPTR|eukprot:XP_024466005.1 uncharacterized protein LOC112328907 [Populus trichocarpa]